MENQVVSEIKKTPIKCSKKKTVISIIILLVVLIAGGLLFVFLSNPLIGLVTISWNSNTESNLAGYRIYYGDAKRTGDCPAGGYPDKVDVGNVVSYKISNLQPGKTYYFSVTSCNTADKESCFSAEVNKTIEKAGFMQKIKYYFWHFWKK